MIASPARRKKNRCHKRESVFSLSEIAFFSIFPMYVHTCAYDKSSVRVNLREIVRDRRHRRRYALFTISDVPCNILQTSLSAHATGSRPCADHKNRRLRPHRCPRFFFVSSRCYSFHSPLPLPARRKFYACKFLGDSRERYWEALFLFRNKFYSRRKRHTISRILQILSRALVASGKYWLQRDADVSKRKGWFPVKNY